MDLKKSLKTIFRVFKQPKCETLKVEVLRYNQRIIPLPWRLLKKREVKKRDMKTKEYETGLVFSVSHLLEFDIKIMKTSF